ncbi:MAG: hypothetical protein KGJ23_08230 [Euryarchaeota archaeon]|nr:hypothetical protein [Euryarchaeota archaeon]MDE1836589.1 hypothetical protein [Euryarchaeota archaeon]MDE1879216.1 hypothetical protein [Euryarchaeota archaeon]MDE2044559.1 hypothetical protein [Thermoplasmata archaeon]
MAKRAGKEAAPLVDTTTLYVDLGPDNTARLNDVLLDLKEKEKDEKKRAKLTPERHIKDVLIVTATQYFAVYRKLLREGKVPAQTQRFTGEVLKWMPRKEYAPLNYEPIPPEGVHRVGLSVDVGPKLLKQLGWAAGLMNTANRLTNTGNTWKTFDSWLLDLVLDDLDVRDSALNAEDLKEEDEEVETQSTLGDEEEAGEEEEAADGEETPAPPSSPAAPASAGGKA